MVALVISIPSPNTEHTRMSMGIPSLGIMGLTPPLDLVLVPSAALSTGHGGKEPRYRSFPMDLSSP